MKNGLGALAAGSLMALGAAAFLGWSTNEARAQSPCTANCLNSGWGQANCRSYCFGNRGPRVYGYYGSFGNGAYSYDLPAYYYYSSSVPPCWAGNDEVYSTYPCWAQNAFSRRAR